MCNKIRNVTLSLLFTVLLVFLSVMCFGTANVANADYAELETVGEETFEEEIEPRGLLTQISLTIGAGDGRVWAKARNDFTLGTSVIIVYVELYSSETYQEDYSLMQLESRNYTADLNIYQTLETSASTNGVQKYWLARMRYKFDGRDWVVKNTKTHLFDAEGRLV